MITSFTSIARLARQTRAVSLPLLVAGALAAGCASAAANPGGPNEPVGTPSSSASASASASSSPSAPKATPVPTVSGGPVIAGATACAGWPTNAPHGRLTAFFQPVAVERCVTGFQQIPGKGDWETATLEKSTDNLAALVAVLMQPPTRVGPAVICPEFAVIPPQVLLINSAGKELIPQLPVGACGTVGARVLSTLAAMSWQPVSVRLISKVNPAAAPRTLPGASIGPQLPHALRTAAS
jgi:hypothetical protein